MFNATPDSGDALVYHQQGNSVIWNFTLELLHSEAEAK